MGVKSTGLGKSLMRQRFRTSKNAHINTDGSIRHTHEVELSTEVSVTQQTDLEAFLADALLADTDFTAEKLNVTFVVDQELDLQKMVLEQISNEHMLVVPKRPHWDKNTTPQQLHALENAAFLTWRRSLAVLEDTKGLVMTPYERNIEVWRQLWRTLERSHLVVQIVDARNPLLFRCKDLDQHVQFLKKSHMLLVNKADLLSTAQRLAWAKYFEKEGIPFVFFSAAMARQLLEEEQWAEEQRNLELEQNKDSLFATGESDDEEERVPEEDKIYIDPQEGIPKEAQIIGALELLAFLTASCPPPIASKLNPEAKLTIGFVGYPNVGKSSTMNALVGAKKCSVGSTPGNVKIMIGKTKHFQTIHISPTQILVDCPGLVFPSFAATKAEMVVNGVLPIDQLRESLGPVSLITERIPKYYLEAVYGIKIVTRNTEGEVCNMMPTASEFLCSYAVARGYTKSSQGNPDESRAARYILKDYVSGKLLFVHPPPPTDAVSFNREVLCS